MYPVKVLAQRAKFGGGSAKKKKSKFVLAVNGIGCERVSSSISGQLFNNITKKNLRFSYLEIRDLKQTAETIGRFIRKILTIFHFTRGLRRVRY